MAYFGLLNLFKKWRIIDTAIVANKVGHFT